MPIKPGTKVKVKDTFPHNKDGEPGVPGHRVDRLIRGRVGTVVHNDTMYENFVELDPEDGGHFYDHELEVI